MGALVCILSNCIRLRYAYTVAASMWSQRCFELKLERFISGSLSDQ